MIHAIVSVAFCVFFFLLGLPWSAMFWLFCFYFGREHAQAEYRYIEAHGGKRADCPLWCGFVPSVWTGKSLLDFLLPFVVSASFAVASFIL